MVILFSRSFSGRNTYPPSSWLFPREKDLVASSYSLLSSFNSHADIYKCYFIFFQSLAQCRPRFGLVNRYKHKVQTVKRVLRVA